MYAMRVRDGSQMSLRIIHTSDERLVGTLARDVMREALESRGHVLVLAPSLGTCLDIQRELAATEGLAMGVSCETPETWLRLRWPLYGDGRTLVSSPERAVLMSELLSDAGDISPLGSGDGTVEVLCQLARQGLPWLPEDDGPACGTLAASSCGCKELGADDRTGSDDSSREDPHDTSGPRAHAVSAGEARAVQLVRAYGERLRVRGLVEPCEAQTLLPQLMEAQGFEFGACVLIGFTSCARSVRELVVALAGRSDVVALVRDDGGPGSAAAREGATSLTACAAPHGIACEVSSDDRAATVPDRRPQGPSSAQVQATSARQRTFRARELDELLGSLFRAGSVSGPTPTGAVRLLEPAGPLAVNEVVCEEAVRFVAAGTRKVVVVAPDAIGTWSSLAPKLQARGLSVRAQLSVPALATRAASSFLRLAEAVARLAELAARWPKDPAEPLPDMSWWPPRDLSDVLLSSISGVPVERAWARDASWRGNRILTPAAVLKTLQNPKATSPELASAVRELRAGHLGVAAGRLMRKGDEGATAEGRTDGFEAASVAAPESEDAADDGCGGNGLNAASKRGQVAIPADSATSGRAQSQAVPESEAEDVRQARSAERALWEAEDDAALAAVAEVGRVLRAAGIVLEGAAPAKGRGAGASSAAHPVSLSRLVELARCALGRVRVTLRPRLACAAGASLGDGTRGTNGGSRADNPNTGCEVLVTSPHAAAALAPASVDALIYLGLDAGSAPIGTTDGALEELLSHAGVDEPQDPLVRARAEFLSCVRACRTGLSLVRPLRDARAQETFPAVMLSEVVSCYGEQPTGKGDSRPGIRPMPESQRDEGLVEENLSATGERPEERDVPFRAAAGRLDDSLRRLVLVPRDGEVELPEGRPSLSASQIETYLECPYKWLTLRRLGLDDCDAGFSNLEMGTFAHRVLEVTHRQLFLEASEHAGLLDENAGERPSEGLFWFDPAVRVPGSRVTEENLDHARELLHAEFAEHLVHQRLEGSVRGKQALVPHSRTEARGLVDLERDLADTLAFESTRFRGFEPRLFEGRFGGSSGLAATYAGADLVGTIDRIDVDAEGRALVIDYKHKSGLFDEYALKPRGYDLASQDEFVLPRRVQTLVYASVARRLLEGTGIHVVGAVYLGTRGNHQIAGAVGMRDVDDVWGGDIREAQAGRVTLPVKGARDFDELLDRTEERIAEAVARMRAGVVDADPIAPDACAWCPVLDCERRRSS